MSGLALRVSARLLWRVPLLLLLLLFSFAALVLVNPLGSRIRYGQLSLSQHTVRLWARLFVWVFSLRVVRFAHAGAHWPGIHALLVANHQSWQDIIVLLSLQPMHFVAKREIRAWPVFGAMVAAAGTVFIERGNNQSTDQVRGSMQAALQAQTNVVIFPEGGVPTHPGVGHFYARLFAPAIDAMLPIQPLCLRYVDAGGLSQRSRFRERESFTVSLLRLLGCGAQTVEVHYLPTLMPTPQLQRKAAALQAETMIRHCYAPNPNDLPLTLGSKPRHEAA